jgi:hypothetical protein
MTHKPDDDEASFEGLLAFDSVPPPGGASDVHNARTTVAELPDSFLDSLRAAETLPAPAASRATPLYQQPYPASELPRESMDPMAQLRAAGWRGALVALIAMLVGFGAALWLRALLAAYL